MIPRNIQAKKPASAEIEMAVRAVEGIPNAMDMDFADVDPDPTSHGPRDGGRCPCHRRKAPSHQHPAEECIVCGQPLGKN